MSKQKYTLPILALILAEVLWGINTPVIKVGLRTVPLPLFLSLAIMGAALCVLPFAIKVWKKLLFKDFALIVIGSLIAITLGNTVLLMGLRTVPATNAALIGLFSPFILFILSVEFLREHLSLRTFIGILVAFSGAVIVIGKPWQATGVSQAVVSGNLLIVLAALCDVTGTLIFKSVLKRVNSYQLTFLHLFSGSLPIAIYSLRYIGSLSPGKVGRNGFTAIIFNIVAVAAANCLFMYALKHKRAQDIGVFQYIHPVTTAVAAWFILAEMPSTKLVIGALLIFTGIYLAEVKHIRKVRSLA